MKNKIKAIIAEMGLKQSEFALILNLSPSHLSEKLNGKYEWSKSEIDRILKLSGRKYEDIFLNSSSTISNFISSSHPHAS